MHKILHKAIIALVLSISCLPVYSQQTVLNVPSADITPKNKIFLQQEAQFRPWGPGAFFLGTTFSAYGIGYNTEIDMTLFNVRVPHRNRLTLGTGFKTSMPIKGLKEAFPEREFKFTVGSEILTSLQGKGVGNWTYSHLSGRLPVLNTRLTEGITYGGRQVFGRNAFCFISAIEQPITDKFELIAEWYSGDEHFVGYFIPGFSYKFPKDTSIYVGYQIPNSPEVGKAGFVIQLSKIF